MSTVAGIPDPFAGNEAAAEQAIRRARWKAAALRRHYGLGYVPEDEVAAIAWLHFDREHERLIYQLRSGARIVDAFDRISVLGPVDASAIAELVKTVARRGWTAVTVTGSDAFQREVAFRLALLEPPVPVADSKLTDADQMQIAAIRAAREPSDEAAPASPGFR